MEYSTETFFNILRFLSSLQICSVVRPYKKPHAHIWEVDCQLQTAHQTLSLISSRNHTLARRFRAIGKNFRKRPKRFSAHFGDAPNHNCPATHFYKVCLQSTFVTVLEHLKCSFKKMFYVKEFGLRPNQLQDLGIWERRFLCLPKKLLMSPAASSLLL